MSEPLVYLNGKLIPESQAGLKVYDAGIVLGATTTEMTRTFGKVLFRIEDHVDRLFRSLKYMNLDIGLSKQEVMQLSVELTENNTALIPENAEIGLIHFVTPGEFSAYAGSAAGRQSMKPTVCMHTFPMPFQLWAEYFRTGIHVITPSTRHVPPQCVDPKMKNRSRMHWYLADRETHLSDPNAITLLLDLDGNITETAGANFLIVRDGVVLSPTLRNILPGVSRQQVIEICTEEGIEFLERDLQIHDVANADEAFLSTTPYCMAPCTRINGIQIGNGTSGPIYKHLMEVWSKKVGLDVVGQVLGQV